MCKCIINFLMCMNISYSIVGFQIAKHIFFLKIKQEVINTFRPVIKRWMFHIYNFFSYNIMQSNIMNIHSYFTILGMTTLG